MQMNITFLANVKPGPLNYIICVRVSRMWEFRGRDEENEIRHLDLVVIDQKVKISFKLFISLPNFEYCNSPTIFLHINIRRLNYMEITSLYFYLQGYSMYAEIPPDAIPLLQPHLQEGKIVYMTKITIHNAKQGYRPVESPYMIRLNIRTQIAQLQDEPSDFPKYAFSLAPFPNLYQHAGNTEKFLGNSYCIPTYIFYNNKLIILWF